MVSLSGIAVVAATLLVSASGQATDCGASKSATGKFSALTLNPQTPASGQPVNLFGVGTINEVVTGGAATLSVLYSGIPLFQGAFNTCGATNISLPLGVGTVDIVSLACPTVAGKVGGMTLNVTVAIPPGVPPGGYEVILNAADQETKPAYCADAQFTIGSDGSLTWGKPAAPASLRGAAVDSKAAKTAAVQ